MVTTSSPPRVAPALRLLAALLIPAAAGCSPTVKIEAPDKPIEINLNVRIEQEVRVKLERDVDDAIRNDPALFGLPTDSAPTKPVPKTAKGKTP